MLPLSGRAACCPPRARRRAGAPKAAASCRTPNSPRIAIIPFSYRCGTLTYPWARNHGHVKVVSIWSAGACSRFLGGQLAARPKRAGEQARRKRQQAAALQIRPDRHYPVILPLWDFDVPLSPNVRATSKSRRYGVRELAPAFWAGSLLPAESAPARRRAESGSKLPHSKFARIAIIPLSYRCGTLTYPWARNHGHVKVASIWSAGACSRFLGGQLTARRKRAGEEARRKRQQAAALQIRPGSPLSRYLTVEGL